ncbi:MAG: metallophosphoesterase family protein [Nitrososphaerota archaeon]|nr:metallophosphoesterase family protein [Nitrososphaerota archaeon]
MLKVVPDESALIHRDGGYATLLVSDLHLGLEKEMASKGFRIPPYSQKMLDRMNAMAEKNSLNRVIVVGDVKHSIGKVQDIDWGIIPWFFGTLLDVFQSVEVVPGNHDGMLGTLLPGRVKLHSVEGTVIGERHKIGIAHGHSWPSEEVISSRTIVMGHSHFRYEMRDRFGSRRKEAVWLFARYDVAELLAKAGHPPSRRGEGRLIVMPPFNNLVGGQAINAKGGFDFGPILSSGSVRVSDADVFLLDGTRVG